MKYSVRTMHLPSQVIPKKIFHDTHLIPLNSTPAACRHRSHLKKQLIMSSISESRRDTVRGMVDRLSKKFDDVVNISAAEVSRMTVNDQIDPSKAIIVDVRTPEERMVSYIPGRYTFISYNRLASLRSCFV